MKILVDADSCPVRDIIIEEARKMGMEIIMYTDTNHFLRDGYSKVNIVDQGKDSVDIALVNSIEKGDIVVTQDYGLAAMSLSKGAFVMNQNGMEFNGNNIDRLLFERFISQKVRRSGGRAFNPSKRKRENDISFRKGFKSLCIKAGK